MQEPLGLEEQDQFDREMRPKDKHWDDLNLKGPQMCAMCAGNNSCNTKDNADFRALTNCTKDA